MWRDVLPALADRGLPRARARPARLRRLAGRTRRARWERHVEALERFATRARPRGRRARRPRLGRADRPALGVRPPGRGRRARHLRHRLLRRRKWRGPGEIAAHARARASSSSTASTRDGFAPDARRRLDRHRRPTPSTSTSRRSATSDRRRGQLELYRSGDFEKLEPYEGKLARARRADARCCGAPTTSLAPVAGRAALRARRSPAREVVVLDGTGHFVFEDAPDRYAEELVRFLRRRARARHAELVVALVALVDRAGGVDVDGQRSARPDTAGPGPRRARARPARARAPARASAWCRRPTTTTSNAPAGVRPRLTTGTT